MKTRREPRTPKPIKAVEAVGLPEHSRPEREWKIEIEREDLMKMCRKAEEMLLQEEESIGDWGDWAVRYQALSELLGYEPGDPERASDVQSARQGIIKVLNSDLALLQENWDSATMSNREKADRRENWISTVMKSVQVDPNARSLVDQSIWENEVQQNNKQAHRKILWKRLWHTMKKVFVLRMAAPPGKQQEVRVPTSPYSTLTAEGLDEVISYHEGVGAAEVLMWMKLLDNKKRLEIIDEMWQMLRKEYESYNKETVGFPQESGYIDMSIALLVLQAEHAELTQDGQIRINMNLEPLPEPQPLPKRPIV